jgi:hypothetical protein
MNEVAASLKFERRPAPVFPEHRPLYKIGQLVLTLSLACNGAKSSLTKLHLFNWALKDERRWEPLLAAVDSRVLNVTAWGFDPALAIALRFALGERLVEETKTGYKLTDEGRSFAKELLADLEIFGDEKRLFQRVGKKITEEMVDVVAKGWEAE